MSRSMASSYHHHQLFCFLCPDTLLHFSSPVFWLHAKKTVVSENRFLYWTLKVKATEIQLTCLFVSIFCTLSPSFFFFRLFAVSSLSFLRGSTECRLHFSKWRKGVYFGYWLLLASGTDPLCLPWQVHLLGRLGSPRIHWESRHGWNQQVCDYLHQVRVA